MNPVTAGSRGCCKGHTRPPARPVRARLCHEGDLSELDRRLERFAELALYSLLLIIPTTGLALLFFSGKERELRSGEWQPPFELVDDDLLLGLHIAAHIAFYVALLVHVGIALRRRTLTRIF
ncbi:hypothetical protein [Aeromicrobium sp.]|uniref:hypothetical protein n=1 Tax=Aeromicrobium sp. TaxID=1871063 RepID=UPI003C4BA408